MHIFEVREYPVREGKMGEWVSFMEDRIVPFIVSKGMVPVAMFRSPKDPNLFVWIRRFENEKMRTELYKAVYESDEWQADYRPVIRNLVDVENAIVHDLVPTTRSPLQ